ncbi:TraR/DksA family transcriptional regulator [Halobacteriovorax sp. JY17]|uniref:TraR/DksA family transcriptional regulator n=1 Tax=Halobacteriovorax sp. JY17 TaxID=2014617 RepID=UPI000C42640F|nr:TraR/DksA family transcriptional regulator [Halobacteriovorax sp. JY17]PIK14966.1 MAG: conjugal transfer protein TraR [Halobacteriovorax sp. JY17]
MGKVNLEHFKQILLKKRQDILNGGLLKSTEDLQISSDDLADEADLAQSVINQQVTFNMRQRELGKLRAIEAALERVEDGTYGFCEDCDDPIGSKRLENQPWTTLCITHAEEQEREQSRFGRIG